MSRHKLRKARRGETNGDFFDRYSLLHGIMGGLVADHGWSASTTLAAAIAFELAETKLKMEQPKAFPVATYDSAENMVGDVISAMIGWKVVDILSKREG